MVDEMVRDEMENCERDNDHLSSFKPSSVIIVRNNSKKEKKEKNDDGNFSSHLPSLTI